MTTHRIATRGLPLLGMALGCLVVRALRCGMVVGSLGLVFRVVVFKLNLFFRLKIFFPLDVKDCDFYLFILHLF